MSILEVPHEFFDTKIRTNEQLYQAFCNHVYCGQWLLARLILEILYPQRLTLNENLEDLLVDIIRNPTAYCTESRAVPTPFHFALLLLEECRVKQYLKASDLSKLKHEATFKYLLAVGDIQPTPQVVQEFDRIHTSTDVVPSSLLTNSMADFLVDLWLNEIPRIHALVRLYLNTPIPSIHLWLVQIHKRALEQTLQQLKSLNNEEKKNHLVDLLLSLHFYSCENNEFRSTMKDILKKIVIYASEANNINGQLFNLKLLYRSVLINEQLARFISDLESEYRRDLLSNEIVLIHFMKKNSFEKENMFWKEVYLYLIENKTDLITCVLNDAISMMQNRDYSSLDQLLNIEELNSLHLYIFLLCWTHARTINDASVLHESIRNLENKSPLLEKCLKLFQSHIDFIAWLSKVRRIDLNHDGVTTMPNTSDLLALLHTSSPLSLIHRYLDVQSMSSAEILQKIRTTSMNMVDDDECVRDRREVVRFEDEPEVDLDSLRLPQIATSMIYHGYLAINSVIQRVLSLDPNPDANTDLFATAKSYLTQVFPLRFRLELLENIFSLIFIQQSELKIEETIDIIEQSTHSISTSLSNSEKLISSTRSNGLEDSLLTSRNASNRPQLSNGRSIQDLEELGADDDNVSICSSSMSSAGASHQNGMYRSGLLIDQEALFHLLNFVREQIAEIRSLSQKIKDKGIDRDTVTLETSLDKFFNGHTIASNEQFDSRATKLSKIVSDVLWRYNLLTSNPNDQSKHDGRQNGQDNDDRIVYDTTIKNLMLPLPRHRHRHRKQRRSRLSEGSASSGTSSVNPSSSSRNGLVSQILSSRDNLLAICLKEGKITEANEVIRIFNMQDHPLAVEAEFSKLFHDTIDALAQFDSTINPHIEVSSSKSVLAGIANLTSAALGNASLQNKINPLVEAAQSPAVSSTLPISNYFDHEHFASLTLFDLAINAPTMNISKTLLDMAQHRLPLSKSAFVSNSSVNIHGHSKSSSTTSSSPTTRIKTLHEMINSCANLASSAATSFRDLLLDATIPLDGNKATKIIQFYKKLEEHCRQFYSNEKPSNSLEQQMKISGEFFENEPLAKFDLITYIKSGSTVPKLTSSTHVNYFGLLYTYLQNFRLLLEQFPIHDAGSTVDFTRHSPLTLVQRIVARSSDIDLAQLQLMTSKLNIDISLAVSLNIIRPLFADKTIASSTLSTNRQTTLLQQQRIDIFTYRQQLQQQKQMSQSISTASLKRPARRSGTILQRSISRAETIQSESNFLSDHPEVFVRTRLTRLLDLIRRIVQDFCLTHLIVDNVDKLTMSEEYDDILNSLQLIAHLDLNRLATNEERLCFFVNLYNLLIILSHTELIRTTYTKITTTKLFRNDLERLLFMLTTRLDVGQLKQISLFDIRYHILHQVVLIDGLDLHLNANGPFYQYAPKIIPQQQIKVGLLLNDCIFSSAPFVILTPELVHEQLQRLTRDFIDKCVLIQTNETDKSMFILIPDILQNQFHRTKDQIVQFIGEYSSNNDVLCAITDNRTIKTEVISSRTDFVISLDYRTCAEQCDKRSRRRRSSSLPSINTVTTINSTMDFLPASNANLPNHLIDNRTIAFVQEKSPALGQILHIYVQSVVHNQSIETDRTPLRTYFTSLLLSPDLIESKPSIADEWFRSIVLNDLTYQHDLLLDLSSSLWNETKYTEIVTLFDSLLPAFIVHSPYCQILRDLALLSLIKKTSEPDRAYHCLRKIHDCHLLVFATIHYLPRFDGPTCLKLLQLCLTSCKKFRPDYVDWIQERLNVMYVYKTLCLGALSQFNKCMDKLSNEENQANISMEDMATRKTSSKCLTWQRAEEHSQTDPLAVVDMFILEKQFDMGHEWLKLLKNQVDESVLNRVRYKLVTAHIHRLLDERNIGDGNKILQIIDTIENRPDKWLLCKELIDDLSEKQPIADTKSIPFSQLFVKYRIIQYMLEHFDENSGVFEGEYKWSNLSILATGLSIFFNCIPLEQTDSYVHLVAEPLLMLEQLLMNSSTDTAKSTIETLKILSQKYSIEKFIQQKRIDELIEFYTKKSVKLNVVQPSEEVTLAEPKPTPVSSVEPRVHKRRVSLVPSTNTNRSKETQEASPLGRRNASGGSGHFLESIRQRMLTKPTNTSNASTASDFDASIANSLNITTSPGSSKRSTPTTAIPIMTKETPPQSSSLLDYISSSLSNRNSSAENSTMSQAASTRNPSGEFTVPITATPRTLWISDDEVAVCMCCNETSFSMFNRRHHCRHCGRVVCKGCSSHLTEIKNRLERTCNDCFQYLQNNATKPNTPTTRTEPISASKKRELLRPAPKLISPFKRKSISQTYLGNNRQYNGNSSMTLLGTSLVNDPLNTVQEDQTKLSSSFSTVAMFYNRKLKSQATPIRSTEKDETEYPALPIINDQVHYVLTGTSTDEQFRQDFHYDQSPSISLCLSLIELHSDQYQCGKILISLCEYLSEQLSSKQRNVEIDYGLVLNIIKDLLGAAKIKLTTAIIDDEQMLEQHKLIASCETYWDLVDILNSLNMVNFPLPALNDLLQSGTRRRIRNQLLDDERYELATDITSKYDSDTQMICFQWGMAFLQIGRFAEARDKFDRCLQKLVDDNDKQRTNSSAAQEKMLNDIITQLESMHPLRYSLKHQYLVDAPKPATDQRQRSVKYLNNLHNPPILFPQANKIIEDEIRFYLTTYSDDAHLIDYYIRHELYSQAFQHKCSLNVFRDHIYLPLLKRNKINKLFSFISTPSNHPLSHHLKYMCNYFKEQDMNHSLQQLLVFMNDYMNAAFTSIKIFTTNRTSYSDLCSKRLVYLLKATEYFKQAKIDTEQTMIKVQNTKNRINLQIEVTRYIDTQLKRLGNNGSTIFLHCPTLFDSKEAINKLISGMITVADTLSNVFTLIHKIIQEMQLNPEEIFIPCGEDIGKRRDYRLLQQLLQVMREHSYTDSSLHDEIIGACIRETGSDVEQSREQDTIIQMIKNDDKRISVYTSVGKLRAAYLIAIRLGKEDKVRSIRDDAQKSGQTAVYDMCKKWLENRASE